MTFYEKEKEKVVEELDADPEKGLTEEEVERRKEKYGPNKLKEEKEISPLKIFFRQFKSFIIYILLFAIVISVAVGEWVDSVVILVILVFNALFGFFQEYKAEKAIESLEEMTSLKAEVLRGSERKEIDTESLVPGDIVLIEEGDKIPADMRILSCSNLDVREASLTGESLPIHKTSEKIPSETPLAERENMLYSGTAVNRGKAKGVVTGTGMETEIGKIAGMISEADEKTTPLQKDLRKVGKWIGTGTLVICFIIFLVGMLKEGLFGVLFSAEISTFIEGFKTWLLVSVSLAVAAVPEGLPAIVTVTLALGVKSMVKKNVLVRKLPSVETLGSTTVICTDKTGTLTKNQMTVTNAFLSGKNITVSGAGYSFDGSLDTDASLKKKDLLLFKTGVLCNNAKVSVKKEEEKTGIKKSGGGRGEEKIEVIGDPTEAALHVSAEKAGMNHGKVLEQHERLAEIPFDSERKMMSVLCREKTRRKKGKKKSKKSGKRSRCTVYTKGALSKVIEKCSRVLVKGRVKKLTSHYKKKFVEKNKEYADGALRVLAFAYKPADEDLEKEEFENDLILIGLQAMMDPPREDVKDSIEKCEDAGIRVMMITGDNKYTAKAIANDLGISGEAIEGEEFEKLSDKEQAEVIREHSVFARVAPKHKKKIVDLLDKEDEVVAMTGDGVNDAPALKEADIGVAMGETGTDVAKESGDMILEDDNFTSIVNAVEVGRGIYDNIQKFVNYLLSSNLAEVVIILLAIIFGWPLPMTAIMILWLNLVTDGFPALALSVDPASPKIMKDPPKSSKKGILNSKILSQISYAAVLISAVVLCIMFWGMGRYGTGSLAHLQTLVLTAMVVLELARVLTIRVDYGLGFLSNRYLLLAIGGSAVLHLAILYTPLSKFFGTVSLPAMDWVAVILPTILVFLLTYAVSKSNLVERVLKKTGIY